MLPASETDAGSVGYVAAWPREKVATPAWLNTHCCSWTDAKVSRSSRVRLGLPRRSFRATPVELRRVR